MIHDLMYDVINWKEGQCKNISRQKFIHEDPGHSEAASRVNNRVGAATDCCWRVFPRTVRKSFQKAFHENFPLTSCTLFTQPGLRTPSRFMKDESCCRQYTHTAS